MSRKNFTIIVKSVDYTRDPREVIRATGRTEDVENDIVATMPRLRQGIHENVKVVLFRDEREREAAGFTPDPYAQAAANEQDPSLADDKPNITDWNRKSKMRSYLAFYRWYAGCRVSCRRGGGERDGRWYFAGVRKS